MGVGGLLRAQRRPRLCCHFTRHFYVAFSKEICCMPLQMLHYSYEKTGVEMKVEKFPVYFQCEQKFLCHIYKFRC